MLIMNKLKLQEQYYDVILYRSRLSVSNIAIDIVRRQSS